VQQGRSRTPPAPAEIQRPHLTRVQFANQPMSRPPTRMRAARPGCSAGCSRHGSVASACGAEYRLEVALDVEQIDRQRRRAPLFPGCVAQARPPAVPGCPVRGSPVARTVAEEHPATLEDAYPCLPAPMHCHASTPIRPASRLERITAIWRAIGFARRSGAGLPCRAVRRPHR
jgi:hypothetical protein